MRPLFISFRGSRIIIHYKKPNFMNEQENITATVVRNSFARLEKEAPVAYAFYLHAGAEHMYLQLADDLENSDGTLSKLPSWSLGDVLSGRVPFGAEESLCLFADFRVEGEEDDDDYEAPGFVEFLLPDDLRVDNLKEQFVYLLDFFCELCLRENRPFLADAADAARLGLTDEQASTLRGMVEPLNVAAAARLQKAYDRLKGITCIRK